MNIKKLYFFYSLIAFLIFFPVFVSLYLIEYISLLKLTRKEYLINYLSTLKCINNSLIFNKEGIDMKRVRGGFNNHLVKINIKSLNKTFLLKKYTKFGSFFTWWGNLFTPYGNSRKISARDRIVNEVYYYKLLQEKGINTPRIIGYDKRNNILITEFIEGELLDRIIENNNLLYRTGELIAKIHSLGIYINDNTPLNYIYKDNNIYIIDPEGFSQRGNRKWDLAIFIFWIENRYDNPERNIKKFINGYNNSNYTTEIEKEDLERILSMISLYKLIFKLGCYLRKKI